MTAEDLKRMYREAATERERAEIELQFWTLHGVEARKKQTKCVDFLHEELGVSKYEARERLFLIRLGSLTEPLWSLIDGEMTIATAVLLARKAKSNRIVGEEDADAKAIARTIEAYNRLPVKKQMTPGKFVRMARWKRGRPPAKGGGKSSRPVKKAADGGDKSATTFRAKIRALVLESLSERLRGHDELVIQEETVRFETDLKILLEGLEDRIHERRRSHGEVEKFYRRRDFQDACRVIHLDAPRRIDDAFEKIAKRNFKELARQYHTDVSGSDTKEAFDAVMKAWKVIESFIEQEKKKGS